MPSYIFQCDRAHVTELVQSIHDDLPATVTCEACQRPAQRVFLPPAAIHFRGRGFYATDVKGSQERKRRPNPGDGLHIGHDDQAAAIARSL